jgi:hypothetical protein
MLDFLDKIAESVINYRISDNYKSIFKEISPVFYRENFHSDIIAYYLENKEVKKIFFNYLNQNIKKDNSSNKINFNDYAKGIIKREKGKIDILLQNNDFSKAIIVENKSNNASDQIKQIYRYYNLLTKKGILVEAIFYLSKSTISFPDLHDIKDSEKQAIKNILVPGQLIGLNGFCDNIINQVINTTKDEKLKGLSMEILDLFYSVVYGDINMDNLEQFSQELAKNNNLIKLQQAMKAYNDLPIYYARVIKDYIDSKNKNYKVWFYKTKNYLVIDFWINNTNIAIDIIFKLNGISSDIFVRKGSKKQLEDLRDIIGKDFPFHDNGGRGYDLKFDNLFEADKLKKIIDNIFNGIKELNKQK